MKSVHRFFLLAAIFCLVLGTVPAALALEMEVAPPEDPTSATLVKCGDPTEEYILDAPTVLVDYYSIQLVSGQVLKVDVDAESLVPESSFDYMLMLFDIEGNPLAEGDDELGPGGELISPDPVLQFTAVADGTYIVAVSTYNASKPDPYKITFECTDQGPVSTLEIGDLLASTGLIKGSLLSIDQETETSELRFPLGKFGQVADIEFRDDGVLFGAAVGESGSIITIDLNSGVETLVGTLTSGAVVALEFGGDPVSLYGIYLVSDEQPSQLGIINQENGAFSVVGDVDYTEYSGYSRVDGLAFDSRTGTMYGVGPGSEGIELMTIDLATGVATEVGPTGVTSQIFALEFGPDGSLYGATDVGTLVTINTSNGVASEVFIIGEPAPETATQAFSTSSAKVSGLAFVPGWDTPLKSKTITSLDDSPYVGRLIDKFKFKGTVNEIVTIKVTKLNNEGADNLQTEDEGETPATIETRWHWSPKKKLLEEGDFKGRGFMTLRDAMDDVHLRVRVKGQFPLELIDVPLPATGLYKVILMQPVPRALRVDYSLTMTSSGDASTTLEATRLIEPRNCTDGEDKGTADNTEQSGGASTLQSTSLTSTDASTPVTTTSDEPVADGGDPEVGQTLAETPVVEPVAEIPVVTEPAADGGDPEVVQTAGDETTVEEPVVVTVDEPVVETPVAVDPAADGGSGTESGDDDDSSDEVGDDTPPDEEYSDDPMEDPLPMKG